MTLLPVAEMLVSVVRQLIGRQPGEQALEKTSSVSDKVAVWTL